LIFLIHFDWLIVQGSVFIPNYEMWLFFLSRKGGGRYYCKEFPILRALVLKPTWVVI
jgi:hypothetical protein